LPPEKRFIVGARQGDGGSPQQVGEVPVERYVAFRGYGTSERQGDGQDRVRAQARLVVRAVQFDHRPVEVFLTI
jgi:hypothetical protein